MLVVVGICARVFILPGCQFQLLVFLVICATLIITMERWQATETETETECKSSGLKNGVKKGRLPLRQSLTILADKSFQFVTICCSGLCKLAHIVGCATLKTFSLRLHLRIHLTTNTRIPPTPSNPFRTPFNSLH